MELGKIKGENKSSKMYLGLGKYLRAWQRLYTRDTVSRQRLRVYGIW